MILTVPFVLISTIGYVAIRTNAISPVVSLGRIVLSLSLQGSYSIMVIKVFPVVPY